MPHHRGRRRRVIARPPAMDVTSRHRTSLAPRQTEGYPGYRGRSGRDGGSGQLWLPWPQRVSRIIRVAGTAEAEGTKLSFRHGNTARQHGPEPGAGGILAPESGARQLRHHMACPPAGHRGHGDLVARPALCDTRPAHFGPGGRPGRAATTIVCHYLFQDEVAAHDDGSRARGPLDVWADRINSHVSPGRREGRHPEPCRGDHANSATTRPERRLTIEATTQL